MQTLPENSVVKHAQVSARLGRRRQSPYPNNAFRALWERSYDDEMKRLVDAGENTPPETEV